MDRLLYEIALRTQHKATAMDIEARKLGDTVDRLRDENRALKRRQRSQKREINEKHDFVDMANLSLKGFRKDVRFSEENCVDAHAMYMWETTLRDHDVIWVDALSYKSVSRVRVFLFFKKVS